jgi:hypothetical protein
VAGGEVEIGEIDLGETVEEMGEALVVGDKVPGRVVSTTSGRLKLSCLRLASLGEERGELFVVNSRKKL